MTRPFCADLCESHQYCQAEMTVDSPCCRALTTTMRTRPLRSIWSLTRFPFGGARGERSPLCARPSRPSGSGSDGCERRLPPKSGNRRSVDLMLLGNHRNADDLSEEVHHLVGP